MSTNKKERVIDDPFAYMQTISTYPVLSKKQITELCQQLLNEKTAQEATKRLIESNLMLVVSIANKKVGRGVSLGNLIETGNRGLAHATATFNPSEQNMQFSTWAVWGIRYFIQRDCFGIDDPDRIFDDEVWDS